MNIQEALDRIDMMRPNMMKKVFKIAALSELDGRIWQEIIQQHEDEEHQPMTLMERIIYLSPNRYDDEGNLIPQNRFPEGESEESSTTTDFAGYTVETDPGTELLAPFPYDEIYTYWLAAKVDWQNLEMDKYANDRTLFNNAWRELDDYWTRTHMPKQKVSQIRL